MKSIAGNEAAALGRTREASSPVAELPLEFLRNQIRDPVKKYNEEVSPGRLYQQGCVIHSYVGYNFWLSGRQAAAGVSQLDKFSNPILARCTNFPHLYDGLSDLQELFSSRHARRIAIPVDSVFQSR